MPATTLPIGEFARLTYLSVPALRHYHEVGVLVPASVDGSSGYRRYTTEQVPTGQLIRRLRALEMPLPQIRAVVEAGDPAARDAQIAAHLDRMERQLAQTATAIASLRALLSAPVGAGTRVVDVPAAPVLALTETVRWDDMGEYFEPAFAALFGSLAACGVEPAGPPGGLYAPDYFEQHEGPVQLYVPVLPADLGRLASPGARMCDALLPAGTFAVREHRGPYDDLDLTYSAIGLGVADEFRAARAPIREVYVVGPAPGIDPAQYRTDVHWPLTPNGASR